MYNWLETELEAIRTKRFHVVDGPAKSRLRRAVSSTAVPAPPSYKEFVLKFGNAKFFRNGIDDYHLEVFASPRLTNNEWEYCVGNFSCGNVLFKIELMKPGKETPVFEYYGRGGLQRASDSFAEWLEVRYARLRKKFGKKGWQRIVNGPEPFSPAERAIADAVGNFHWKVLGPDSTGRLKFLVENKSDRVLPFLSIGIEGKQHDGGFLHGGIWLPVHDVPIGKKKVIHFDCYSEFMAPEDVQAYAYPKPESDDREYYREFE